MTDRDVRTGTSAGPVICWFRTDLRLADNPALAAAVASKRDVICVFVLETDSELRPIGGATRWWLHHSLKALAAEIEAAGATLSLFEGRSSEIIPKLCKSVDAGMIVWTRRYGEAERTLDGELKRCLQQDGLDVQSFNGHLLYEPWEVKTGSGGPFKVFTPFWKAAKALHPPVKPHRAPSTIKGFNPGKDLAGTSTLDALKLLPTKPDWAGGMRESWVPGEAGAHKNLKRFLSQAIGGYANNRNRPSGASTSSLSPHLKFGELSPRQIWQGVVEAARTNDLDATEADIDRFLTEIGWRDFSYHLLYQFPKLATDHFQKRFDAFPWRRDQADLHAWQRGRTGYPIVDAAMSQLWHTGWMHNRMRMVAASFLSKHLLIDWREGEAWFWDTLVDADPASNSASWQWVAGSGADAAPFFRIFNPVTQGEKFDTQGDYVRTYVPELAKLPPKFIHKPWLAPPNILETAGVTLGGNYPKPIVAHDVARKRALAAFASIA